MDQDLNRLVRDLLERQLPPGHKGVAIDNDSRLLDIGLDSLNMMSFWVALERNGPPGIDIGKLDFGAMETVADVVRHVEHLCALLPARP